MKTEDKILIDPFKGNAKKIEMSRYIDLDIYHRVERTHPFYVEMVDEICNKVKEFTHPDKKRRIMEIGAGTGLLTGELLRGGNVIIDAVEIDEECCGILRKYVNDERVNCICDNAVTYCREGMYDIVVSSFAHDHIHYNLRYNFVRNIKNNLKPGGIYIMGGEVLPFYETEHERKSALYTYHCYIINKALRERHFEVAQIEINALKSGLDMKGDFKRHELMFEEEMASADFKLLSKRKIGPLETEDVGGVFVYVYGK